MAADLAAMRLLDRDAFARLDDLGAKLRASLDDWREAVKEVKLVLEQRLGLAPADAKK